MEAVLAQVNEAEETTIFSLLSPIYIKTWSY